jgi:hypothetical protein
MDDVVTIMGLYRNGAISIDEAKSMVNDSPPVITGLLNNGGSKNPWVANTSVSYEYSVETTWEKFPGYNVGPVDMGGNDNWSRVSDGAIWTTASPHSQSPVDGPEVPYVAMGRDDCPDGMVMGDWECLLFWVTEDMRSVLLRDLNVDSLFDVDEDTVRGLIAGYAGADVGGGDGPHTSYGYIDMVGLNDGIDESLYSIGEVSEPVNITTTWEAIGEEKFLDISEYHNLSAEQIIEYANKYAKDLMEHYRDTIKIHRRGPYQDDS